MESWTDIVQICFSKEYFTILGLGYVAECAVQVLGKEQLLEGWETNRQSIW